MANSFSTQDLMFNSPSYLQYAAQQYGGGVDPRTLTQQEQNILNDSYASGIGSNDPYLVGQRASANMQAQQPQQSTPSFTSTPIPEASANTDAQAMKLADSITANGVRNAMQATKTPDWYKQNGSWLATLGQKALASGDADKIASTWKQIEDWTKGAFSKATNSAYLDAFMNGIGDTYKQLQAKVSGILPSTPSAPSTGSASAPTQQPVNKTISDVDKVVPGAREESAVADVKAQNRDISSIPSEGIPSAIESEGTNYHLTPQAQVELAAIGKKGAETYRMQENRATKRNQRAINNWLDATEGSHPLFEGFLGSIIRSNNLPNTNAKKNLGIIEGAFNSIINKALDKSTSPEERVALYQKYMDLYHGLLGALTPNADNSVQSTYTFRVPIQNSKTGDSSLVLQSVPNKITSNFDLAGVTYNDIDQLYKSINKNYGFNF